MAIQVINNTSAKIQIAINQWGNDGNTDFFNIKDQGSESWDRTSELGFIMRVKNTNYDGPWYVEKGVIITFNKDNEPKVIGGRAFKIIF